MHFQIGGHYFASGTASSSVKQLSISQNSNRFKGGPAIKRVLLAALLSKGSCKELINFSLVLLIPI